MRYSHVKQAILSSVNTGDMTPIYISGAPGCGKTSVCIDVAEDKGIPRDVAEACIFRPSLRDPVDLTGVPHIEDGVTKWATNSQLAYVNGVAERYGFALFIIDELPQAVPMMQNALAGLMHDRFVSDTRLHDDVFVVATGNRAKDKAGAGRVMSQLANRVEHLEMDADTKAFSSYMMGKGYDPLIAAYIRYRPDALDDFNPDAFSNATMRSWEAVAKVDTTLPSDIYYAKVAGRVGEGRAAEYIGFRRVASELPKIETILAHPETAPMPQDHGARYAAVGLLVRHADPSTFGTLAKYAARFATEMQSPELEVVFYMDSVAKDANFIQTPEYVAWGTGRGQEVLL